MKIIIKLFRSISVFRFPYRFYSALWFAVWNKKALLFLTLNSAEVGLRDIILAISKLAIGQCPVDQSKFTLLKLQSSTFSLGQSQHRTQRAESHSNLYVTAPTRHAVYFLVGLTICSYWEQTETQACFRTLLTKRLP